MITCRWLKDYVDKVLVWIIWRLIKGRTGPPRWDLGFERWVTGNCEVASYLLSHGETLKFSPLDLECARHWTEKVYYTDPEFVVRVINNVGSLHGDVVRRYMAELTCRSLGHEPMTHDGRTCLCGQIEFEPFDLPPDFEMREAK